MKIKLHYTTTNDLKERIFKRMGIEMANKGKRVLKKDIVKQLANYCEVSEENIERIIKNYSQPSLPVAIKIAQFFNVPVEDIFKLKNQEKGD